MPGCCQHHLDKESFLPIYRVMGSYPMADTEGCGMRDGLLRRLKNGPGRERGRALPQPCHHAGLGSHRNRIARPHAVRTRGRRSVLSAGEGQATPGKSSLWMVNPELVTLTRSGFGLDGQTIAVT